eukprot:Pgem_evm1s19342
MLTTRFDVIKNISLPCLKAISTVSSSCSMGTSFLNFSSACFGSISKFFSFKNDINLSKLPCLPSTT